MQNERNDAYSMKNLTDNEIAILNSFPGLSAEELEQVNDLYKHYVFVKNCGDGWEVSTSCCHVDKLFIPCLREIETPEEHELLCRGHNEKGTCPYCGKPVTFKRVGKCGKFKNLYSEHPVAIWHYSGNTVYVQCYWTRKEYSPYCLAGNVLYSLSLAYAFMPNCARAFYQYYREWNILYEGYGIHGRRISICEPFCIGGMYGNSHESWYTDIGRKKVLEESWLKYCQLESFESRHRQHPSMHASPMKYLSLYCVYPYAVEMLMKNGMLAAISDYVFDGKKNAASIKWDERTPKKAFGLDGQELRAFMELPQREVPLIEFYKRAKKYGWKMSFRELYDLESQMYGIGIRKIFRDCKKFKTTPAKFANYLDKHVSRCSHGGGFFTISSVYDFWNDYIVAAEAIGYDLRNGQVVFPRDLRRAHDDATGEHNRRLELARKQKKWEEELKRAESEWAEFLCVNYRQALEKKQQLEELKNREARYCYGNDEFFIRPAADADEIIAEGKKLEHCVGGYAQRHCEGKLTICFMRRVKAPNKPFLTIEMQGKKCMQVHGYKNEVKNGKRIAPAPREAYKDFLNPWLEWVSGGSRRDKQGKPVIKNTKKKKTAKTAA